MKQIKIAIMIVFLGLTLIIGINCIKIKMQYKRIERQYSIDVKKDININELDTVYAVYKNDKIIINGVKNDNQIIKNIVSVNFDDNYWLPEIKKMGNEILIVFQGYNQSCDYINYEYDYSSIPYFHYNMFTNSFPYMIRITNNTKNYKLLPLKKPRETIIVDYQIIDNKIITVLEKNILGMTSGLKESLFSWLPSDWGEWYSFYETTGEINNTTINHKIIGNSMLNAKGCIYGDNYIYPAIDGIYSYNLKTKKDVIVKDIFFNSSSKVVIWKHNNAYYIINDYVLHDSDDWPNSWPEEFKLVKYDNRFNKIMEKEKLGDLVDIIWGKNGFVIICAEDNAYKVCYSPYAELDMKTIVSFKKKEKYLKKNIPDTITNIDLQRYNYANAPHVFFNGKRFVIVDRRTNKIINAGG